MSLIHLVPRPIGNFIQHPLSIHSKKYHSQILIQSTKQLFSRETTTTNVTTSKIKKNNFTFSSHDDEEQKKATYERLSARLPSILNEENTMSHTAWMMHLDWEDMLPRTPIDELLEMGYKITKDSPEWLQNSPGRT